MPSFQPMIKSKRLRNCKWSHQAICNLLRSATYIFLMQTLGKYHELKANMLDKEEFIVANIKENDPAKKEIKIIKWLMFNEMPTTPVNPSYFLPEQQHNQEGGQNQNDTLNSLTNLDQTSPTEKKKRKDDAPIKKQRVNRLDVK